jgi:hypothetical protein
VSDFALAYRGVLVGTPTRTTVASAIDARLGISSPRHYLINVGFLTLTFEYDALTLVAIDAYTNKALWRQTDLPLPKVHGVMALTLPRGSITDDDDRSTLAIEPDYSVNYVEKWTMICLDRERASEYYEVGAGLVAGISGDVLTRLFLLNVEFE